MPPWIPLTVLFWSSVLWGLSWWPLKQLSAQGLSGMPLIFVAYGSVGLLLLPLLYWQRKLWRPHWPLLLLVLCCGGVANIAFPASMIYGEVIRSMVLFYLLPVWGVLGGRIFLGERLTPSRLIAVAMALTGAVLLLGGPGILAAPPSWVDAIAILSGFAFAMTNLSFRATPQLPVPSKVAAVFLGCLIFSSLMLLAGAQEFPHEIDPVTLVWAVAFGVGGLLLATSCTQWAVTKMEAGRSSVVMVMELVSAVVSAALITGADMSAMEMTGGLLVLLAAVVEACTPATHQDAGKLSQPA
ncbi:MAG: DMT family transporter [Pedobacter sp.]|nr:DMT family transporter [Pedobacter sp.]